MKFKTLATILLAGAFTFSSCDDFLDKTPTELTDENFFNNSTEASSFLDGVFAILTQTGFYSNNYFYLAGGDDMEFYGGSGRAPATMGLVCNNATASDAAVATFWQILYSGINRANIFLENIDKVSDITDSLRAEYVAEARFLRAFYYFNLVECWGDVPFRTHSTTTVVGLSAPRTSKDSIYNFICDEMAAAADDLPTAASLSYSPSKLSKSTAWGILARVYMFRAGEHYRDNTTANTSEITEYFTAANKYAKLVKEQGGHSLAPNYWDVFIDECSEQTNTTANEMIWQAEFTGNYTTSARTEGRVGNIIGIQAPNLSSYEDIVGKADPGFSYCFFWSTPKLYELYVANGDINRMNWNIAPFTYTQSVTDAGVDGRLFEKGKLAEVKEQYYDESYSYGDTPSGSNYGDREKTYVTTDYGRMCGKWRREYEADKKNKNFTSIDFPILRYSDVLLMIAETENEINNGPTDEAYECINAVRERAGISDLEEGMDYSEFLQAVKDERGMELCFEMLRRFDLIRWGDYVSNMNELATRAKAGTNWTLGPTNVYTYFQISSAYNYFPIPTIETSTNKLIGSQNPGW
jgi:hypothetical protein